MIKAHARDMRMSLNKKHYAAASAPSCFYSFCLFAAHVRLAFAAMSRATIIGFGRFQPASGVRRAYVYINIGARSPAVCTVGRPVVGHRLRANAPYLFPLPSYRAKLLAITTSATMPSVSLRCRRRSSQRVKQPQCASSRSRRSRYKEAGAMRAASAKKLMAKGG